MNILVTVLYFAALLALGYVGMKRTKTLNDFFLGGRTIGPWVSAFAYGTTYFSAVLIIGFAGKIGWGYGFDTMWIVVGNTILGTMLAWLLLAKRTRAMSFRLNVLTMPAFLGKRFDSQFLKVAAALIIFVFLLPYCASVFMGLSYLFEVNMQIPYWVAVLAMGIGTAIYLIVGGYHAVALTDLFQGIIMVFGAIMLIIFVIIEAGGFGAIQADWGARYAAHIPNPGGFWGILPVVILTSLGPLGLPQMVQKFYAIKSESVVKPAIVISTLFCLLVGFAAYFTGSMSHMFFDKLPAGGPDLLVPTMISNNLPGWLGIIMLLLVLSASMSTLSSLILVSGSSVAIDLHAGVIAPKTKPAFTVNLLRLMCALFMIIAMVIALAQPTFIVNLMSMSWGSVAGAFLAPFVFGLFWKRTTKWGAMAGMFTGLIVAVTLYLTLSSAQAPWAAAAGMLIPLVVVPAVSLVTRPMPEEHVEIAFAGAAE